jgi:hypothetical protein
MTVLGAVSKPGAPPVSTVALGSKRSRVVSVSVRGWWRRPPRHDIGVARAQQDFAVVHLDGE